MAPAFRLCALSGLAFAASATLAADADARQSLVWVDPVADVAPDILAAEVPISRILYVNRCLGNCVITPGVNDARANTSSILQSSVTLSEFSHGDEVFDGVIACLRDVYAPYDVEVVTDDPGAVPHHEAILAGTSAEFGFPNNVLGLAPASCEPLDNVISFSFANSHDAFPPDICATVAQESAHSYGLPNHVLECSDPMTYIQNCGTKYFRDLGMQCGETEPDECRCLGGNLQNSHRTLLSLFGPGEPLPPPVISIARPGVEASVSDGFAIQFSVNDIRAGDHVYVFINGTLYADRPAWPIDQAAAPYVFNAPEHPDGYMTIEVRARNELGTEGRQSLRVLKGEPCSADNQCLDGQSCVAGGCAFPPADRALGDECEISRECATGLCPEKGGAKFCSEFCDPNDAFSCPISFECLPVDGSGICWPEGAVDAGGGCCQVSSGKSTPPLSVVLLALVAGLIIGRRCRGRA